METRTILAMGVLGCAAIKGFFDGRNKFMTELKEAIETDEQRKAYSNLRSKTWMGHHSPKTYIKVED